MSPMRPAYQSVILLPAALAAFLPPAWGAALLLTLLAFAVYLFWLNPWLAALSLSIYPAVVFLVPLLQRRVNAAG